MIEKMKLLHITGPKNDIDRVVKLYLNQYDIHFENAMTSLNNLKNVRPFVETNLYKDAAQKGEELKQYLEVSRKTDLEVTAQQAQEIIFAVHEQLADVVRQQERVQKELRELKEWMVEIAPFIGLDFELCKLRDFHFIDYQFGKIKVEYYHKLEQYVYHNPYTLFYECNNDSEYVWGVYFAPHTHLVEIEAVYDSFHFEAIQVPDDLEDTPRQAFEQARKLLQNHQQKLESLKMQAIEVARGKEQEILAACECLESYCDNFEIRKYAACTSAREDGVEYYILYGWMARQDADKLQREIAMDENINCVEEEPGDDLGSRPPTRLKNPKILKPFEMFVEMYGLPGYNEMDPTLFIALTYTFMFGVMFGDVGQGACLLAGGILLYKIKNIRLAGIVGVAGVWSVIFGFLYGSFFGFEEVIPALWMKPMDNIMTTLMLAIGFGGVLILVAMVLNMVNAVRAKEYGRLLFHQSGLAGLICYGFVFLCVLLFAAGYGLPATILIGTAVGVPLIAILLKEPLSHLIERKGSIFPEGSKVMFFVEALVEGFDVVLSYATNTISFVRVGAFALSHAGMMGVVMTLAGLEKGNPNWMIIILGNALVAGLEGLVVGIQVLRLEYYEMFSRFYTGDGKPFIPFRKQEES
ncbi:ATPase [Petralouisia muris]|uniref:ATPase n=1 Tax=Petralouisia muris TaxID=3032872 RepID=A0AC61S1C4_9FIRM|nr:V-type ATPase 116kDa subunit family protein [Petralouisia muris]TGY98089.1 ATPase [Petralouisia muris]